MFKEDSGDKNGIREGILIDFDFAIDVKKHFKTATGERSVSFARASGLCHLLFLYFRVPFLSSHVPF